MVATQEESNANHQGNHDGLPSQALGSRHRCGQRPGAHSGEDRRYDRSHPIEDKHEQKVRTKPGFHQILRL